MGPRLLRRGDYSSQELKANDIVRFNGAASSQTRRPNYLEIEPPEDGEFQWGRVFSDAETQNTNTLLLCI